MTHRTQDRIEIGVQLYTLRSLRASFPDLAALVASAGADGVQTDGRHDLEAAEMRDVLEAHELKVIGSHVGLAVLEQDLDAEIAFAKVVGNDTLVVPYLAEDERPTDAAGWAAIGERLGRLGARCREAGLALAYHNHDFELATVEGRTALDWLFSAADPRDLEAEIDLGWIARAGGEPLDALRTWGDRMRLIHLKDVAANGTNPDEDGWAAVGEGTLDWPRLLPEAVTQGVTGWVIEHDRPRDPAGVVRASCGYLRRFLEDEGLR